MKMLVVCPSDPGGTLTEVDRMDGFTRAFDRIGGKREVVWQGPSMSRELRIRQPAIVQKKDSKFKEGELVRLPRALQDEQLFGYAWGDWDHDGTEDFAVLQSGERLRLFFKDAKWSTREVYGGSRADFNWEQEQIGTLYPRLLSGVGSDGKNQLLVPHNIPATPIRLARLKIYKQSELVSLKWNGLEMAPAWILPISGALMDFGVADLTASGKPQLWVAAVGAGDKTILLSYQLP